MSMNAYMIALTPAELEKFRRDPALISAVVFDRRRSPGTLQLHKMWQALHFMLTGTAWDSSGALGQAILGGADVGPDIGYGPARILTPTEVQETSDALGRITAAEFKRRFAPEEMEAQDIYPTGIWVAEKDTITDDLVVLFEQLVAFYRGAASRKDSALLWMS